MDEILLGKSKQKLGTNEDNFKEIELSSYEREIMDTDDSYVVDVYKQYFKEKDASENYRLSFTITPYCTNVLFNMITEPVYKEGSSECMLINDYEFTPTDSDGDFYDYNQYVGSRILTKDVMVDDTGYSHPSCGGIKYHCGYNIFNNHYLRKKNFIVVNKRFGTVYPVSYRRKFNMINDYARDINGSLIQDYYLITNDYVSYPQIESNKLNKTLYEVGTLDSYVDSILKNLSEENGWFGFVNKATLPVKNYGDVTINKCMNDCEAGDFVDMYPDRTLFSFKPKYNEYRKRVEQNWDTCITYPYSSTTDNYLIHNTGYDINGIKAKLITEIDSINNLPTTVLFKTFIKHNLSNGDSVSLSFIYSGGNVKKTGQLRVESVGINDEDTSYYFSIRTQQLINELISANATNGGYSYSFFVPLDVRVRKCENGIENKYYVRIFKKIATFNTQLSKLGFAQNVYSDSVAQLSLNEDIVTSGLSDNLNRPISELYLTIIKRNAGYTKWYENDTSYGRADIEYSHCFGEVTSGFDLQTDKECEKYNVHRIHSISVSDANITPSPEKLETGITINKDTFFGDIVEFSPSKLSETVLEDVYQRFNTAQRETNCEHFRDFRFTEMMSDNYDNNGSSFKAYSATTEFGVNRINLVPEGYFYKPHYLIKIKDFKEEVNEGYHIAVNFEVERTTSQNSALIKTDENYYFQSNSDIRLASHVYVYLKNTLVTIGYCDRVSADYKEVHLQFVDNISLTEEYKIFKHNTEMPSYAYDFKDGSGKYIWREVMSFSEMPADSELYNSQFTNGAHYFHENISFYLKRQDPDGRYKIGKEPMNLNVFLIENKKKDVEGAEYKIDNGTVKC